MFERFLALALALAGTAALVVGQVEPEAAPPPAGEVEAGAVEQGGGEAGEEEAKPAGGEGFSLEAEVRRLGHEDFKERRAGQEALLRWGEGRLDEGIEALYKVYRGAEDPEVRLRSREVLRQLVIVKQPFDGEGYLGIQMDQNPNPFRNEKGELQMAVLVTDVREGTAAEVANLLANDLITGVDGMVFDDLSPTRSLSDYIKSKKPGDVIKLKVQRGAETMELSATLRRRSPLLNRLSQWGTELDLPPQAELDEADFQDWLRARAAEERKQAR